MLFGRISDEGFRRIAQSVLGVEDPYEKYPLAGDKVSGLTVGSDISNTGSIDGYLSEYTVLEGVREIPLSDFETNLYKLFYAQDDVDRAKNLAARISENGYIDPLIIILDKEGVYILEGVHRLAALGILGVESLPALVVVDDESFEETNTKEVAASRKQASEYSSVQEIYENNPEVVFTTKELATMLGISTNSAYRQCIDLMEQGLLFKYGYRTKDGWEDAEYSDLHTQSLGWEWHEKGQE